VSYNFHLLSNPGEFSILVSTQDDIELWNVTINDSSYNNGQFGFYNFSQQQVEYSGFEETTVPIPGAVWLLSSGLVGMIGLKRRLKRTLQ
jgi:hypothetical protein